MTWNAGDSQSEKFEKARGFYVACRQARRRPGKALEGFQKALGCIPMRQLRALAARARQAIHARLGKRRLVDGYEPMGCDGSRIECPRDTELERRLGKAGKIDAAPRPRMKSYRQRLHGCRADDRRQTTSKATREWPRRKPHEPPKPPALHTLNPEQKILLNQHIGTGREQLPGFRARSGGSVRNGESGASRTTLGPGPTGVSHRGRWLRFVAEGGPTPSA